MFPVASKWAIINLAAQTFDGCVSACSASFWMNKCKKYLYTTSSWAIFDYFFWLTNVFASNHNPIKFVWVYLQRTKKKFIRNVYIKKLLYEGSARYLLIKGRQRKIKISRGGLQGKFLYFSVILIIMILLPIYCGLPSVRVQHFLTLYIVFLLISE